MRAAKPDYAPEEDSSDGDDGDDDAADDDDEVDDDDEGAVALTRATISPDVLAAHADGNEPEPTAERADVAPF